MRNPLLDLFRAKRPKRPSHTTDFTHYLKELGIEPNDPYLFSQAFRHVTAATEKRQSNERLEFVGDAILDAVVANYVFEHFPDREEGFLSKIKSAVVNRNTLNKLARELRLQDHIQAHVHNRQAMHVIGGNALEALIGAIYRDKGYTETALWIEKEIIRRLDLKKLTGSMKDPKSMLYEMAQQEGADLSFEVASSDQGSGPPFTARVLWKGQAIAEAESRSKKEAEQKAARKALALINAGSL